MLRYDLQDVQKEEFSLFARSMKRKAGNWMNTQRRRPMNVFGEVVARQVLEKWFLHSGILPVRNERIYFLDLCWELVLE